MAEAHEPMQTQDIAIIIPHYNDVVRLERCLTALMANDLTGCEVMVVDNGSTQSIDEVRARFPAIGFCVEPEKGAAAARNRGVRETRAPILMFIDADCVPAEDWVATGRRVAGRADLVGGRVDVFDETAPPRSGAEAFEAVFAFDFRHYIEVQGFSGTGNLVTRRDVFEDVGPFRGGVSEDTDWSFRATAKGYRLVYEDALRVAHPSRSDWAALRGKWLRLTREQFGLKVNGRRSLVNWVLKALAMPVSVLVHIPRILSNNRLSGPGERLRAIGTLIRLRLSRMIWMLRQAMGQAI